MRMASDEGHHRSMPLFQGNLTTRFMHTVPSQHSKDLTLQQYRVYGILPRTTNVYGGPTSFVFLFVIKDCNIRLPIGWRWEDSSSNPDYWLR